MPSERSEAAEQVLEKINALLPEIEQRAQQTEDLRRIPDETVSSLEGAGFFKLICCPIACISGLAQIGDQLAIVRSAFSHNRVNIIDG